MTGGLHVLLNMDEHYQSRSPDTGMLSVMLEGEQRERYLDATFKELVKYVLNEQESLDPDQENVMSAIVDKMTRTGFGNVVLVKLYDADNNPLSGQSYPQGDIYLEDTVRQAVGDDAYELRIGISSASSVG